MSSKTRMRAKEGADSESQLSKKDARTSADAASQARLAAVAQRVRAPHGLTPGDVVQLQQTLGNQAVGRLLSGTIQRRQPAPATTTPGGGAGLPSHLQTGIEQLSGLPMDNVRVHYNSPRPAQLGALAYTQGADIHVAPGQERHLPHEAWHVVQQAQGRVQPTLQLPKRADAGSLDPNAPPINDDAGLEREADVMGARANGALSASGTTPSAPPDGARSPVGGVVQRKLSIKRTDITKDILDSESMWEKIKAAAIEGGVDLKSYDAAWDDMVRPALQKLAASKFSFEYASEAEAIGEIVRAQGADNLIAHNPQRWLYKDYWESLLPSTDVAATKSDKYWKKYKGGGGSARSLGDVVRRDGPALLNAIEKAGRRNRARLKLYRNMDPSEAEAILKWLGKMQATEAFVADKRNRGIQDSAIRNSIAAGDLSLIPTKNHFGDRPQAASYLKKASKEKPAVMVEFTLKPGAHELLFSSDAMALAKSGTGATALAEHFQQQDKLFPEASGNEGVLAGYVGVKPEDAGDFSLGIGGNDPSKLLFQLMLESVRIVGDSRKQQSESATEEATTEEVAPKKAVVAPPVRPAYPREIRRRGRRDVLENYLDAVAPGWRVAAAGGVGGGGGAQGLGVMAHAVAEEHADLMPQNNYDEVGALAGHGMRILRNGGRGARCFIYSIVMGLTGLTERNTDQLVNYIAATVPGAAGGWIAIDSVVGQGVIQALEAFFGQQLDVFEIQNGAAGPIVAGRGGTHGGRPVIIRNTGVHYDAYYG